MGLHRNKIVSYLELVSFYLNSIQWVQALKLLLSVCVAYKQVTTEQDQVWK